MHWSITLSGGLYNTHTQMGHTHFITLRAAPVLLTFDPGQPPTALWKTHCSGYIQKRCMHVHTHTVTHVAAVLTEASLPVIRGMEGSYSGYPSATWVKHKWRYMLTHPCEEWANWAVSRTFWHIFCLVGVFMWSAETWCGTICAYIDSAHQHLI